MLVETYLIHTSNTISVHSYEPISHVHHFE